MTLGEVLALLGIVVSTIVALLTIRLVRPNRANELVRSSQDSFRSERQDLIRNRAVHVAKARAQFDPADVLPGSRCISPAYWRLSAPVAVDDVEVSFDPHPKQPPVTGTSPSATALLPFCAPRRRYARYADALAADKEIRPELWWDGPAYDLRSAEFDGRASMVVSPSHYFEMLDVCESLAHELVRATHSRGRRKKRLSFRDQLGDPFDCGRRPLVPAFSVLTIFRSDDGTCRFLLHARNEVAVASSGNHLHVVPGGIFQPSSWHGRANPEEADLWQLFFREFAEELLDFKDAGGEQGTPIDWGSPPFSSLATLRDQGHLVLHVLGMGLDPLSLWPDILGVVVINEEPARALIGDVAYVNPEAVVVGALRQGGRLIGFPFDAATVDSFCCDDWVHASATGCLRLAWNHRETLGIAPRT